MRIHLSALDLLCLFLTMGPIVYAGPIQSLRFSETIVCLGTESTDPDQNNSRCNAGLSLGTNNASGDFGLGSAFLSGSSLADSSVGSFRVGVDATWGIAGTRGRAFSEATAGLLDIVTIDFSGLSGRIGYSRLLYSISGLVSNSGDSTSAIRVIIRTNSPAAQARGFNNPNPYVRFYEHSVPHTIESVGYFPFVYGQPFSVEFLLTAVTGTVGTNGNPNAYVRGAGAGYANFLNTATIEAFEVFDEDLTPVTGATISSDAGLFTPEGSSVGYCLIGAIFLCCLRYRGNGAIAGYPPT